MINYNDLDNVKNITHRKLDLLRSLFNEGQFCFNICFVGNIDFIEFVRSLCLFFSLALNMEVGKKDPKRL